MYPHSLPTDQPSKIEMTTVIAPRDFFPIEDAENIKKACQGWGTDEGAIISILGHRNLFQRCLIRSAYQEIYNEDLIAQLKSELSGQIQKAVCQWVLDPADRDAVYINAELEKTTLPDHRVIIEIACLRSPEDLLETRRAYRFRFRRSLEEDVASHTSGVTRKILVALTSAYRYDGAEIDRKMAESEARVLQEEIHGETANREEVIRILSTRSKSQLNATFNQYKNIYGTSITKALSRGDTANEYASSLIRTAIRCIKNPQRYLAKVLRNAMRVKGTNEEAVSRVIITRAEKDLKEIKELFLKRTSETLEDEVAKETSGDWKNFLLTLLGKE